MIEGAIFDVDGTLLDSMVMWANIGTDYLKSIGFEPKENLYEILKTMSLHQAACYYRSEYGVTLSVEEIIDGVNKMIKHFYHYEAVLKPNIAGFLENLSQNSVKMCVATATEQSLVKAALHRCGILQYFSEVFTCGLVSCGKDQPVIYREALKHLGTDKAKTVVFEDAFYAAATAKRDGFITAAVHDIYEECQTELKALTDFYITDYSDWQSFQLFASTL